MKRRVLVGLIAVCALVLAAAGFDAAEAKDKKKKKPIETYFTLIGPEDLYNSSGVRLTDAVQIVRQDRANVHRYGIRHEGDEMDSFFSSLENRNKLPAMAAKGKMRSDTARLIRQGDIYIVVTIYKDRIDIEIAAG